MPFNIPALNVLIETSQKLESAYKEERLSMDKNRFLASLRSYTDNHLRIDDISFITAFAGNIEKNQGNYEFLRGAFAKTKEPSNENIDEFVRKALAGAYLFHLSKINDGYMSEKSVKGRSALAKLICNLFGVERFSEIPKKEQQACLQDFQCYIRFVTNKSGLRIKWHESKTNRALFREIEEEMALLGVQSVSQKVGVP
ncbi:hypothetical protein [Legionella brunensis]|uniref:Dot/Icm T4SS effector n=1 Tax=Legionella brunensis TaxID=29422 RepID=A0A0W0S3Y6_9GAMM|nr:hypothetical protein [Legionella brunensis]KTC78018.1 hypothetical protein Lbru_2310 [Legionella brunensis]